MIQTIKDGDRINVRLNGKNYLLVCRESDLTKLILADLKCLFQDLEIGDIRKYLESLNSIPISITTTPNCLSISCNDSNSLTMVVEDIIEKVRDKRGYTLINGLFPQAYISYPRDTEAYGYFDGLRYVDFGRSFDTTCVDKAQYNCSYYKATIKEENPMSVENIKPKNLKEAKKQFDEERTNNEILSAKKALREATDEIDRIDREIAELIKKKEPHEKIISMFK